MRRVWWLLSSALLFGGCLSVRGDLPAPTEPWPPQAIAGARPSVSLYIEREEMESDGAEQFDETIQAQQFVQWRDQTLRAYRDSGLFSDVVAGLQDRDFRVHVVIRHATDASRAGAVLTGLTFFVIPLLTQQHISLRTEIRGRDGAQASYEYAQSAQNWFGWLFLPTSPFATVPRDVPISMVYDLNRATLVAAQKTFESTPVGR